MDLLPTTFKDILSKKLDVSDCQQQGETRFDRNKLKEKIENHFHEIKDILLDPIPEADYEYIQFFNVSFLTGFNDFKSDSQFLKTGRNTRAQKIIISRENLFLRNKFEKEFPKVGRRRVTILLPLQSKNAIYYDYLPLENFLRGKGDHSSVGEVVASSKKKKWYSPFQIGIEILNLFIERKNSLEMVGVLCEVTASVENNPSQPLGIVDRALRIIISSTNLVLYEKKIIFPDEKKASEFAGRVIKLITHIGNRKYLSGGGIFEIKTLSFYLSLVLELKIRSKVLCERFVEKVWKTNLVYLPYQQTIEFAEKNLETLCEMASQKNPNLISILMHVTVKSGRCDLFNKYKSQVFDFLIYIDHLVGYCNYAYTLGAGVPANRNLIRFFEGLKFSKEEISAITNSRSVYRFTTHHLLFLLYTPGIDISLPEIRNYFSDVVFYKDPQKIKFLVGAYYYDFKDKIKKIKLRRTLNSIPQLDTSISSYSTSEMGAIRKALRLFSTEEEIDALREISKSLKIKKYFVPEIEMIFPILENFKENYFHFLLSRIVCKKTELLLKK